MMNVEMIESRSPTSNPYSMQIALLLFLLRSGPRAAVLRTVAHRRA